MLHFGYSLVCYYELFHTITQTFYKKKTTEMHVYRQNAIKHSTLVPNVDLDNTILLHAQLHCELNIFTK